MVSKVWKIVKNNFTILLGHCHLNIFVVMVIVSVKKMFWMKIDIFQCSQLQKNISKNHKFCLTFFIILGPHFHFHEMNKVVQFHLNSPSGGQSIKNHGKKMFTLSILFTDTDTDKNHKEFSKILGYDFELFFIINCEKL